jgi:hypothetical protein
LIIGLTWLFWAATPVGAECTGPTDPWPSFREAVPTAQRIIAGEVVAPDDASKPTGYLAAFQLRLIRVLRGPTPPGGALDVVGLQSGLPLTVCADTVVTLLPGDVVILALDAMTPDGVTRINTLAYLHREGESVLADVEDITMDEVVARAGVVDESDAWPSLDLPLVLGGVAIMLLLLGAGLLRQHRLKRPA